MSIINMEANEFASSISAMTDDELFGTMRMLEVEGDRQSSGREIDPDVAHKLVLTEEEIARRHPGQLLQPYLDWKRRSDMPR